eukprot:scaffold398_cov206-Pinguiococcus_pyrenoidosus.AAC.4
MRTWQKCGGASFARSRFHGYERLGRATYLAGWPCPRAGSQRAARRAWRAMWGRFRADERALFFAGKEGDPDSLRESCFMFSLSCAPIHRANWLSVR